MYQLLRMLGRLCVLGVVVISPWWNASSQPAVLRLLIYLVIASGALALASLWTTPQRERKINSYHAPLYLSIPLILAIMLCALQAKPLPDSWLARLSPSVPQLRQVLLPDCERGVTLDSLYGEEGGAARRALASRIGDDVAPTEKFVAEVVQYDDEDTKFDVRRALILDAAAEQQFLLPGFRFGMREWGRTISVYPLATRQSVPMFWAAFLLFLSASILFNTAESRRVLLSVVVFVGLAFALFALAGRANYEVIARFKRLFEIDWLNDRKLNYGTFVNKNAAAGYLVLSFGACVFFMVREFLLTIRLKNKDLENRKILEKEDAEEKVYKVRKESKWALLIGDFIDLFNRKLLLGLFSLAVLYAAILASMSRGGAIAATTSILVALIALLMRKDARRYWFVPCVSFLIVVGALFAMNLHGRVSDRMSTIVVENEDGAVSIVQDGRVDNWKSALKTSQDFTWLGSGLGSYSVVNARNDRTLAKDSLFYYAENTFVQTLVEMGVLGLILLVAAYVMLIVIFVRMLIGVHSIETTALAVAAITTLAGQIVSSCMDFGIYFPCNLFLFFTLCGAFISRQNRRKWDAVKSRMVNSRQSVEAAREIRRFEQREALGMVVFSSLVVLLLLGTKWMLQENKDAVLRAKLIQDANAILDAEPSSLTANTFNDDIAKLRKFALRRNDSCELQSLLAQLYIMRYRVGYCAFLKERNPEAKFEELWAKTDIEAYLELLLGYQSIGFDTATSALRDSAELRECFANVLTSLYAARRICPLQTRVWQPIPAYVSLVYKMTWEDERQLELLADLRGASTTPYDTKFLIRAAYHLGLFRLHSAKTKFLKRAVACQPTYAPAALVVLAVALPQNQLAERSQQVLSDNMYAIFYAAYKLRKLRDDPLYDLIRAKFETVYATTSEERRNYDFYYYAGMYLSLTRRYVEAVDALAKAVEIGGDNDVAFFARMNIFLSHPGALQRHDECVATLSEYCKSHGGAKRYRAEDMLKRAEEIADRAQARARARERIQRDNELDERLRHEVSERGGNAGNDGNISTAGVDEKSYVEPEEVNDAPEAEDDITNSINEIERLLID